MKDKNIDESMNNMEINDKVKMKHNEYTLEDVCWKKSDIGRISRILEQGTDIYYLICFDSNCTEKHTGSGDHTWWAEPDDFELYQRRNKLMNVE